MKYQWLDEQKTCADLSQEIGCPVKSITRGLIVIGYEQSVDQDDKPVLDPITRKGIEIEFAKQPTAEQLAKLDGLFTDFHRAGALSVPDELTALKDRVKQVEDQLKESRG